MATSQIAVGTGGKPATARQISFESFTKLVETLARTPQKNGKKIKVLRRFLEQQVPRGDGNDLFHFYRLLLPSALVEKERGNYQLKEAKLVAVLAGAVGASAADVERAKQWRSLNSTRSGVFHEVMYEVLFRKYLRDPQLADPQRPTLTLEEVNTALDELVIRAGSSPAQQGLLRALLQRCSPEAARCLVTIIMKDVKIGISVDTVLSCYHPDAADLFNSCMDLRRVLGDLKDPTTRLKKRDVVPGQPAKPQLADRCDGGVAVAARRMKGKRFVVEVKFDGERMQVHRTGPHSFNFFSRRGLDHGSKRDFAVLGPALEGLMSQDQMILDGELVVWNKTRQVFEPFGGLSAAIDAINRGASPGERIRMKMGTSINTSDPDYVFPTAADVEVVYVVFDVLYMDGGSVLDKALGERHQLLRRALRSCPPEGLPVGPTGVIRFRAVSLLPGLVMLGGEVYSKEGTGEDDIKEVYERALAKQEEGIVIKALDSPYKLNDRSGTWLKVKPDYVDSGEFDVVVIGAMWGTGGRRGGRLSEYLMALADTPRVPGAEPSTFVSFCRVGTGLNAEQFELVRERLRPLLVELGPGQRPPRCYRLTGAAKERPDVWVREPLRSVVLTVKADVRTIISDTFASRYSLRFPRVVAVREDRSPRDATTLAELERMVLERASLARRELEGGGREQGGDAEEGDGAATTAARRRRAGISARGRGGRGRGAAAGGRIGVAKVPLELRPVDVSHVEVEVDVLRGRYVLLRDLPPEQRRQLAALVKKLGGVETQNFVPSGPQRTSYIIVGRCEPLRLPSDPLLGALAARADLLQPEWLMRVSERRELLEPPPPSLVWSISAPTREQYSAVLDPYGDPYFVHLGEEDLEAVLSRHITPQQMAEARRLLEAAAEMPARARRRARQIDARRHADGRTTLYETADDVVRRIRDEIHDIGEKPPPGSMFLGLTLLFLEMHDIPPPPAPPPRTVAPLGLLTGVTDCTARAHKAAADDPRDRVEALKAAVVRHGGVVVDSWDERVTHLVLYDGVDERDEQLRRVLAAEWEQCYVGTGADTATITATTAAREYSPEEVIEALVGVAECAEDEDAAAAAVAEDEQEEAAAVAVYGSGGVEGSDRRFFPPQQSRCLSLIRAALERPRDIVEVVGAVQLVDWRWVRDSLQRAAHVAAMVAAAAAATAAARRACLPFGPEDEEEDEEEEAEAAVPVGTLSELDYPPRIRPPEEWIISQHHHQQQQQQQQQGAPQLRMEGAAEVNVEGGGDDVAGPAATLSFSAGGGKPGAHAMATAPPLPPPRSAAVRGGSGGGTFTLARIWKSIMDSDSDEEGGVGGQGTATAAALPPAPLPAVPGTQADGVTATLALATTAPASLSSSAAPPPPPDEFIRLWPWERFHICLPGPEELAKLGTQQQRRRRRSDGAVGSTDCTTVTSGGGITAISGGHGSDDGIASAGGGGGGCGSSSRVRSQQRSLEAPSPAGQSPAGNKARGSGCRRPVEAAQMPTQRPVRRVRQRGGAAVGEKEEERPRNDLDEGGNDVAEDDDAVAAIAATERSERSPTAVSQRCRPQAGPSGKAAATATASGTLRDGRKRVAAAVVTAEVPSRWGSDVEDVGEHHGEPAVGGGRAKRPRRAAATAAAAMTAAQSREVEEEERQLEEETRLPVAPGGGGTRRRRLLRVREYANDPEEVDAEVVLAGAVEEPARHPHRAIGYWGSVDADHGGTGTGDGAAAVAMAKHSPTAAQDKPMGLHGRQPASVQHGVAVQAAAAATATAPLPPPLRKRRLKDLLTVPYPHPARQMVPGAAVAGGEAGGGQGHGELGGGGGGGLGIAPLSILLPGGPVPGLELQRLMGLLDSADQTDGNGGGAGAKQQGLGMAPSTAAAAAAVRRSEEPAAWGQRGDSAGRLEPPGVSASYAPAAAAGGPAAQMQAPPTALGAWRPGHTVSGGVGGGGGVGSGVLRRILEDSDSDGM